MAAMDRTTEFQGLGGLGIAAQRSGGNAVTRVDRHDPVSVRVVFRRSLKRLEVGWHQHEAQLQRPKIVDLTIGPLIDSRRRDSESVRERGGIAVVSGNGFFQ